MTPEFVVFPAQFWVQKCAGGWGGPSWASFYPFSPWCSSPGIGCFCSSPSPQSPFLCRAEEVGLKCPRVTGWPFKESQVQLCLWWTLPPQLILMCWRSDGLVQLSALPGMESDDFHKRLWLVRERIYKREALLRLILKGESGRRGGGSGGRPWRKPTPQANGLVEEGNKSPVCGEPE